MSKRKKAQIMESLNGLAILLGFYVYLKTYSLVYAGIASALPIIIFQSVKFIFTWIKNEKLKKSGIHEVDKMDGFLFEEYLALLFKEHGYKARVTRGRGDFGADLIISKNGLKTVVQAKRYKSSVGIKAIQEIIGSVKYYKADEAMVITNNYYTKPAIELAEINNVRLINRDQLIEMLLKMNPDGQAVKINEIKNEHSPICPKCDVEMILRKGRNGSEFYGCSNFPTCRQTINI